MIEHILSLQPKDVRVRAKAVQAEHGAGRAAIAPCAGSVRDYRGHFGRGDEKQYFRVHPNPAPWLESQEKDQAVLTQHAELRPDPAQALPCIIFISILLNTRK